MIFIIQNWVDNEEISSSAIISVLQNLGRLEFSVHNIDDNVLLQKLLKKFAPENSHLKTIQTFLKALFTIRYYDQLTPEKITYLQTFYIKLFNIGKLPEDLFADNLKSVLTSGRIGNDQLDRQVKFHIRRHYRQLLPEMSSEKRALVEAMLTNLQQRVTKLNDTVIQVSKENSKRNDLGAETEKVDPDTDNVSSAEKATIPNKKSSSQPTSVPFSQPTTILSSAVPNNTNTRRPTSSIPTQEESQQVSANDHLQKTTTAAVPASVGREITNSKKENTPGGKPLSFLAVNSLTEK
jgi:hypothetical protein